MTSLERRTPVVKDQTPSSVSGTTSGPTLDDTFEERWATWQSKGRAHREQTRRRMRAIGALGGIAVLAAALAWLLTRG